MAVVRRHFDRLRLNQKFTLVVFTLAMLPVTILAAVLFDNMQKVVIQEQMDAVVRHLVQVQAQIEKTVSLCNMTTQVFQNNQELREYLMRAKSSEQISSAELVEFYRGNVGGMEKLVNANPYLYQVRVYFENKSIPEIMPILYHSDRMKRLEWAQRDWVSGTWQFDYEDTIFSEDILKPVPHIMSLVSVIDDYPLGRIGVLEVAVRMDEQMPELFAWQTGFVSCFVAGDGTVLLGEKGAAIFGDDALQAVLSELDADSSSIQTVSVNLAGERALVSAVWLGNVDGWYMTALFPHEITAGLAGRQNLFLLSTGLLLLMLAGVINKLVKALLRRFYLIVDTIAQICRGNLNAVVPYVGDDEVGMLGKQINIMTGKIRELMDENVNRQLLAKNSEIRALQSQINAHFLYNVLESIKMMAEVEEHYEISDAITALGKLLRYGMRWTAASVTVAEEIDNIQNYIALVNLRFDYRIYLRHNLCEEILIQRIPKLTLQPIVENAVVHGIGEFCQDACLDLLAEKDGNLLKISLTDYGKGIAPGQLEALCAKLAGQMEQDGEPKGGIGLKNVHDRIVMAFGSGYGLELSSRQGGCTRVTVLVPYVETEVEREDAINC